MPFYLQRSESLPDGLRRIAREQIGKALDEIADESLPLHTKVHSLRKRCKKMRGLLRLPQPLMGDAFEVEDQRFREAGKRLAGYRDTQVIARTVESLGVCAAECAASPAPVSTEPIEQSREILADALAAVDEWPLSLHGFVDIGPGFARTYRKCAESWQQVLNEPSDEHFHRLRKWTKYHWYHVRIIERMNKAALRKRRRRVHELQLLLGNAHDLYTLQASLAGAPDADAGLTEQAETRKQALYAKATRLGEKLLATPVDELVASCANWWVDWRR